MMKKRVLSMLMVMIMMVSMLSVSVFAVEGEEGHTHAWSLDWSNDDNGHWHACAPADGTACTVTDVIQMEGYAAHADTATVDGKCDTCGYDMHEHIWSATDYDKNDTYHWNICKGTGTCSVTDPAAMHGYTKHTLVVDTTNTDPSKTVKKCVCGYTVTEHAHVWSTTLSSDENNHWYVCTAEGCTDPVATNEVTAHNWVKQDTSTATNIVYKCSGCGKEKSDHVHVWETTPTWDANEHWFKCVDSGCDGTSGRAVHYDYNSTGVCDAYECWAEVGKQTLDTLTITGLTKPAEGATVDFTVDVAESAYGTPVVKWNRVVDLSKDTSVALGSGATFAGGCLYNTAIIVPINSLDEVSDTIQITLDGQPVPYYSSNAAFNSAVSAYQGNYAAYMAKLGVNNDYFYIMVCAMYPTTSGTHTHVYGSDWIETSAKHYHLCNGCGETKDTEYHYDNNDSGLCDVCGFDMKYFNKNATASTTGSSTTTHTHTYSTDWVEDISNHWKQCTGCGAKTSLAAHADLNNTGKCDLCGFVMTAAAGHTHTFATEWTETFAQHYKVCSCGAKNEIAAHVDLNNTGKCDTCGYAMTTLSNNGIVADTGDHNATFLWMAAFALSAVGAAATVLFARKKREE